MVANINLDAPRMFFPFDELIAFGAEHSTTMLTSLRETAESLNYTVDDSIWFERGASDHFSFLQSGIPGTRFIPALVSTDPEIDADEIMARYRQPPRRSPPSPFPLRSAPAPSGTPTASTREAAAPLSTSCLMARDYCGSKSSTSPTGLTCTCCSARMPTLAHRVR